MLSFLCIPRQSSPNISQFMADKGYDEYYKLEQYYDNKIINIVRSLGAKVFVYLDPIEHGAKVGSKYKRHIRHSYPYQRYILVPKEKNIKKKYIYI